MLRDYLLLLRTAWLGGLWICAYLVRPLLEHQGYFPHHGLSVMHWMVAAGLLLGGGILALGAWQKVLVWSARSVQLPLLMLLLSAAYFGLMPWWKLQMILVHAICALGLLWFFVAPRQVV